MTRLFRIDLLVGGLLLAALLSIFAGCDFLRALAPEAPKLIACAVGEAAALDAAIRAPKDDSRWFAAAIDFSPCAEAVLNAIERSDKVAGPAVAALPAHVRNRIRVIRWLHGLKPR